MFRCKPCPSSQYVSPTNVRLHQAAVEWRVSKIALPAARVHGRGYPPC